MHHPRALPCFTRHVCCRCKASDVTSKGRRVGRRSRSQHDNLDCSPDGISSLLAVFTAEFKELHSRRSFQHHLCPNWMAGLSPHARNQRSQYGFVLCPAANLESCQRYARVREGIVSVAGSRNHPGYLLRGEDTLFTLGGNHLGSAAFGERLTHHVFTTGAELQLIGPPGNLLLFAVCAHGKTNQSLERGGLCPDISCGIVYTLFCSARSARTVRLVDVIAASAAYL